jgi:copper chaperone CopZ
MEQVTRMRIQGMNCPKCTAHVQNALQAVPGVISASVDLEKGAVVRHQGLPLEQLQRAVASAGDYTAEE